MSQTNLPPSQTSSTLRHNPSSLLEASQIECQENQSRATLIILNKVDHSTSPLTDDVSTSHATACQLAGGRCRALPPSRVPRLALECNTARAWDRQFLGVMAEPSVGGSDLACEQTARYPCHVWRNGNLHRRDSQL